MHTEPQRSYFIMDAAFARLDGDWGRNVWNPRDNPIGYHALYYRTDHSDTHPLLHTVDGTVELLPDRVYFIPAYSVLYSEIDGEADKYYIHFQSDDIPYGLYRHIADRCFVPADGLTRGLFETVIENHRRHTPVADQKVRGAMELLLADLSALVAVQPREIERFRPVLEAVETRYADKLTVAQLAARMNLSTVYFSAAFKAAFHVSPKQYLLGKRLIESLRLLARTDLTVREIAAKVGFDNELYFSEFFSQKMHMTASQYRKHASR